MIDFLNFISEKVYEISNKEEKDIEKLVDKYKELLFKDTSTKIKIIDVTPKKYFEDKLDEKGRLPLGDIKVKDLERDKFRKIDIVVSFEKDTNARGEFYESEKEVVLYYFPIGFSTDRVRDILTHELLHAKQHYKKIGEKYKKAVKRRKLPSGEVTFRSNRDYYFDPVEMPVYTTLIINQFLKEYESNNDIYKIKLKSFLRDFIRTGAKPTVDDRAPDAIIDKNDFLKFLYKNRKNKKYSRQYKSFIKKLFWLYSKL